MSPLINFNVLLRVLALLCLTPSLSAQPAWLSEVNLTKPGPHLNIRPLELTYSLSWNGRIAAGTTTIRLGQPDPRYPKSFIAQSYGSTTGFTRRLFPFDFNYTSFLRPTDFRPQVFIAEETDKKEHKVTETRFSKKGVRSIKKEKKHSDGSTKSKISTFTYPHALGVHSAVLWARSLSLKQGEEAIFVVMPFKTPYLCRVRHLGREVIATRRTIKYDLKLQKIDRKTLELKNYDKIKSLNLWISDDAERLPLELRSKVFVGDVRVILKSRRYL